jgi:hypothetical protein
MKAYYDFSKGYKNPHAENILKYGCTIEIHHGPPDGGWDEIQKISPDDIAARINYRGAMRLEDVEEADLAHEEADAFAV